MPNRPQPRLLQALFLAAGACWLASEPRRPKHSLAWSALLFAADLAAIPAILRAKPPISPEILRNPGPARLPAIDRPALRLPVADRHAAKKTSDAALRISVLLPALLLLHKPWRISSRNWLPDYVWGHALTYTVYTFGPLGPAFVDKYRPVVYRAEVPAAERENGNNRNSQYSGHTGSAAFAGVFIAAFLAKRSALTPASLLLPAILPAAIVGGLRVRAQKHFPSDVLLASCLGALFALVSVRGPIGGVLRQSRCPR